jgi:hypothetical protein
MCLHPLRTLARRNTHVETACDRQITALPVIDHLVAKDL